MKGNQRAPSIRNGREGLRLACCGLFFCRTLDQLPTNGGVASAKAREELDQFFVTGRDLLCRDVDRLADAYLSETSRGKHDAGLDGSERKEGFQHAGGSHGVAEGAFQTRDGHGGKTGPEEGYRLHLVVIGRGRAVNIDKGEFVCWSVADGLQSPETAFARARGARDVIGVVANGSGAERPAFGGGVIAARENHRSGRFA